MIASTLDIKNDDFLAGRWQFAGDSPASVTNQGRLRAAAGGSVALIAARVENAGQIDAPAGNVLLGAGRKVTLDMGGPVKLRVDEGALDAVIEQGGAIRADGGAVWLTARGVGELSGAVVNHSGAIQANALRLNERGEVVLSAEGGMLDIDGRIEANRGRIVAQGAWVNVERDLKARGGDIELTAGRTLYLDARLDTADAGSQGGRIQARAGRIEGVSGARLDASGLQGGHIRLEADQLAWLSATLDASGGWQGGHIEVSGDTVALMNARLDASGGDSGGRVHVGGGWQGEGSLTQARVTHVLPGTRILADGARGGEVALWSREHTRHLGEVSAQGGGRIEASSRGTLQIEGGLNAGPDGQVLLDPKNLVITDTPPDILVFAKQLTSAVGATGMPLLNADDLFGSSVALADHLMVVGAPGDDTAGTNRGAVYLFTGASGDFSSLAFAKKLSHGTGAIDMPTLNNNARFGQAVAPPLDSCVSFFL